MVTEPFTHNTTRGPYPAFIGSVTGDNVSGRIYKIPQASRPLKSAERIIQLTAWSVNPDGQLEHFLNQLVTSRTNVPIKVLQATTGITAGRSVTCRLGDHITTKLEAVNIEFT